VDISNKWVEVSKVRRERNGVLMVNVKWQMHSRTIVVNESPIANTDVESFAIIMRYEESDINTSHPWKGHK
jgi:hypothetical protein